MRIAINGIPTLSPKDSEAWSLSLYY